MATNNFKAVTTLPPQNRNPSSMKSSKGSVERDTALAQLNNDKKSAFVKAWEESEKSKVDNKAQKKLSKVAAWENKQKAHLDAKLKKLEVRLEQKKAEYAEKMKNKKLWYIRKQKRRKPRLKLNEGNKFLKRRRWLPNIAPQGKILKGYLDVLDDKSFFHYCIFSCLLLFSVFSFTCPILL